MDNLDPSNRFIFEKPLAGIPPWWRAFIFQLLNGRQLSVYLYLLTLMGDDGVCSPTTRQIARDVGLLSLTMVFDSINVLENAGLLLRARTASSTSGARRNVYQRPSSQYTLLRLLKQGRIFAPRTPQLPEDGLREVLGTRYVRYASAGADERRATLIAVLDEMLTERQTGGDDLQASSA